MKKAGRAIAGQCSIYKNETTTSDYVCQTISNSHKKRAILLEILIRRVQGQWEWQEEPH